jgi:hypothetical protein
VRVRCAECTDFDLCLECFSYGVEVAPHVRTHKYRIVVSRRRAVARACVCVCARCGRVLVRCATLFRFCSSCSAFSVAAVCIFWSPRRQHAREHNT